MDNCKILACFVRMVLSYLLLYRGKRKVGIGLIVKDESNAVYFTKRKWLQSLNCPWLLLEIL